jgi:hypothetical protein
MFVIFTTLLWIIISKTQAQTCQLADLSQYAPVLIPSVFMTNVFAGGRLDPLNITTPKKFKTKSTKILKRKYTYNVTADSILVHGLKDLQVKSTEANGTIIDFASDLGDIHVLFISFFLFINIKISI